MAEVQMGSNARLTIKMQPDGMAQIWFDADIDHPQAPKGEQFLCLSTPQQAVWIAQSLASFHHLQFEPVESP